MDYVEDIRARLDCRVLASECYGVRIKRRTGDWWMASCFHAKAHARGDRNPSLSIGPQGYKCFSVNCGISGDVFDLIAAFEGLSVCEQFGEVLKIAAEHAGVDLALLREQSASFAPAAHHRRQDEGMRIQARATRADRAKLLKLRAKLSPSGTVPSFASYFPQPSRCMRRVLDPQHPRLRIMSYIWSCVQDVPLTQASVGWLTSRGLDAHVAYAHGCRDWSAARVPLLELFASCSHQDLERSGLVRAQESHKVKNWVGLRALHGEDWAQGLAMPLVHPDWTHAPIAWRWRLHHPVKTRRGGTLKALAQYGGDPQLPTLLLGAAPPSSQALAHVSRWPHLCEGRDVPEYVVVVCEGEPDWLSVAEVGAKMETGIYIVALGMVTMASGFPQELVGLLLGARAVACMMDRGDTTKKNEAGHAGARKVVEEMRGMMLYEEKERGSSFDEAFDKIEKKLRVVLQPDDQDVNDLHMQGVLSSMVQEVFGDLL